LARAIRGRGLRGLTGFARRSGVLTRGTDHIIPVHDLANRKEFPKLGVGQAKADHVSMNWVGGHPGVTQPHYHFIVWYISPEEAAKLE